MAVALSHGCEFSYVEHHTPPENTALQRPIMFLMFGLVAIFAWVFCCFVVFERSD